MTLLKFRPMFFLLMFGLHAEAVGGSISGRITYSGSATGFISIVASTDSRFKDGNVSVQLTAPGSYSITNLPDGVYYLVAVMTAQAQTNNILKTDPWAVYGTIQSYTPITIAGGSNATGIDITLIDGTDQNPNPWYKEPFAVTAHSQNWSKGEHFMVQLSVSDPTWQATSVEVTGPGISGTLSLAYSGDSKSWNSWSQNKSPDFGRTPPTPPLTYTFKIVESSKTTTKTTVMQSFVNTYATGLSPSGRQTVKDPITFAWTGVGSGYKYQVQLNAPVSGRVWDSDSKLNGTSASYTGPPLISGVEYSYDVVVTDSYGNASFSSESFIYVSGGQAGTTWSVNPTVNNVICNATGSQQKPSLCSDGAGGAFIAWQDARIGYTDIYAQHVEASGLMVWNVNGMQVCTSAGDQVRPVVCRDNSGGAYIAWHSGTGMSANLLVQRISQTGERLWGYDGVFVGAVSTDGQAGPVICDDGAGGAILTWQGGYNHIYTQRLNSSGLEQWTPGGVLVSQSGAWQHVRAISDGLGGAIINFHTGGRTILVQRVNASGVVQWPEGGVIVSSAPNSDSNGGSNSALCSDGAGGAIITWHDDRSGVSQDVYAQRVNSAGAVQWIPNGVTISDAANHQKNPVILADGVGGAIISWEDARNGSTKVYAQRVNASGLRQWADNGISISTSTSGQTAPVLVADNAGGAVISYGYNGDEIYAQRVNGSGVVQWAATGIPVSTASQVYSYSAITDGAGGAIAVWEDGHRSGDYNIYAQQVGKGGQLGIITGVKGEEGMPEHFNLSQNYPNPFNPSTTIRFDMPKKSRVNLTIYNVLGQLVTTLVNEERQAGSHQVQWNATVPSGIYFYRLAAGDFVETRKMILLR